MKTYIFLTLTALLFISCDDGKLSNAKAEKILKGNYSGLVTECVDLIDHNYYSSPGGLTKDLIENKLAEITYQSGNMGYDLELNSEVKKYLIGTKRTYNSPYPCSNLLLAKSIIAKVVSVQELSAFNTAEVEYVEQIIEVTPIGAIYKNHTYTIGETRNSKAIFIKNNDGWKIKEGE